MENSLEGARKQVKSKSPLGKADNWTVMDMWFPFLCIQATICFRYNDCYKSQNEVSNSNTCLEQSCWCHPANKAYFLKQQQVTYHCIIHPGDMIAAYAGYHLGQR